MKTLTEKTEKPDKETKKNKKQKWFTNLLAVTNNGGQTFYFNYATILAVEIGATAIQLSFITAIQNLGSALLQTVFGKQSDKIGRKLILILGFIIASISTAIISFLSSPIVFMIIIAIYSLGISMVIPTWNALLGDISTKETRTKVISQISMIGSFVSSMILLLLGFLTDFLPYDLETKYRVMIFIGAFFFAFAAILSILMGETNKNKENGNGKTFWEPFKDSSFLKFSLTTLIWWLVMSFLWPLSPIVNASVNPTNSQLAIMSVVFSVSIAFGQWITGKVADKIGRRFTLFLSFVSFCLVPLILAYAYSWYIILIANFFGGIGNGLTIVALNSEILHMAKEEIKGAYSGAYNLLTGIVSFIGSFIGGIIYQSFGEAFDFVFSLKISLLIFAAARFISAIPTLLLSIDEKKKYRGKKLIRKS